MKFKQKLVEFFSLDYRSLALMRVGMGVIIILDLIERARSLTANYTDLGVLTRADAVTLAGNKFFVSLYMMSGLGITQIILFCVAGIFALMLIVGYRTKFAAVASWILLISLHARNPLVLQGADVVFRVILFWMLFLPIEKRWSLDRLFNRTAKPEKKTVAGMATIAYIVQIVLIYVMSGVLKTGAAWQDGSAVYYALSVDQLARPLGEHLRTWTAATHFLTYATRKFETFGSLLYFIPVGTGFFRTLGILGFAGMQIGFNISMHLGLFGAIAIAATLGLLPSHFWDEWWSRIRRFFTKRAKKGLTIYYDTNCGFCFKMVHILKNFLLLSPQTTIASADTDPEIEALMEQKNSWIIVSPTGVKTFGFNGIGTVVGYSPLFGWLSFLFRLPLIRELGEYGYQVVAEKRLLVCLPEKTEPAPKFSQKVLRFLKNCLLLFLICYVVIWNVDPYNKTHLLRGIEWVGWTTRLDQRFDMFSPTPLTEDGWYVIPAKLQNGKEIDLFKDGPMLTGTELFPVSYDKPLHVADGYPDQRWQKYLMNIAEADNSGYRLGYGKYLCRTWNGTHTGDETLMSFDITFMIETTQPEGEPQTPVEKALLWSHRCFDTTPSTP